MTALKELLVNISADLEVISHRLEDWSDKLDEIKVEDEIDRMTLVAASGILTLGFKMLQSLNETISMIVNTDDESRKT